MARPFESQYQALGPYEEEEDECETEDNELPVTEQDVLIHVCPESNKGNWNHIEDLDDFFTRVYSYHQRGGFASMVLQDVFQLVQFVFICAIAYFVTECVKYDSLFNNIAMNSTTYHKITLREVLLSTQQCLDRLGAHWYTVCLDILCAVIGFVLLTRIVINAFKYSYIRNFYVNALKITADELPNKTWHEVQSRLLEVQKEHQMCVHKTELTQLDIYHRILRFKNYMVALVNVNALPLKHNLPFIGEYCYLSLALRFNLDRILFWHWGPGAPFENNWHLKNEFRYTRNKAEATKKLENRIFWFGMINLIFSPLIFIWNCLYCFFRYAELLKRNPSIFGTRRWSNFSRLYLRHFNELDHELNSRLNKGYKPVSEYLSIFTSSVSVICARNAMFMTGSLLAVMVVLTVIDEDVINVEHVLTIMTLLGVVSAVCRGFIPDAHMVHSPEMLLRNVAMAIHYMPEKWAGYAHTSQIKDAFSNLFPFKIVCIVEELVSPLVTPFILLFSLRPRAAHIVDFLRMFTVEVVGVGDICSFAQMDVRKHGNAKWQMPGPSPQSVAPKNHQAENGKTEMSLMHFHMTNPEWKPDTEGSVFISHLKSQVHRDFQSRSMMTTDGQMHSMVSPSMMLPGLVPLQPVGPYTSMMSSLNGPLLPPTSVSHQHSMRLKGAVSHLEGPLSRPANTSLFGSMHSSTLGGSGSSGGEPAQCHTMQTSLTPQGMRKVDECTRELMNNEMNINALFMHELRWRRANNDYLSLDDYSRAVWQSPDGSTVGSATGSASGHSSAMFPTGVLSQGAHGGGGVMPEIIEEGSADDEREVDTSHASPPPSHHLSNL